MTKSEVLVRHFSLFFHYAWTCLWFPFDIHIQIFICFVTNLYTLYYLFYYWFTITLWLQSHGSVGWDCQAIQWCYRTWNHYLHLHFCYPQMDVVGSSKKLVHFYQTTWHDIPADSNIHRHCHENLKSHKIRNVMWCLQHP